MRKPATVGAVILIVALVPVFMGLLAVFVAKIVAKVRGPILRDASGNAVTAAQFLSS